MPTSDAAQITYRRSLVLRTHTSSSSDIQSDTLSEKNVKFFPKSARAKSAQCNEYWRKSAGKIKWNAVLYR